MSKRKEKKRPIMGCIGCHLVVVMGCRMHRLSGGMCQVSFASGGGRWAVRRVGIV